MTFRVESGVGTLRTVLLPRPGLELRHFVTIPGRQGGRGRGLSRAVLRRLERDPT